MTWVHYLELSLVAGLAIALWRAPSPPGGFVNQGSDWRWNPWGIPAWLQRTGSFHSETEPLGLMIAFPPFVCLVAPLPFTSPRKYLVLRAGFRYDWGWPGYIFPEAASKILDHATYYAVTRPERQNA